MKLYLSGPMRVHRCFNFPLFDEVAKVLRNAGHTVASPAEHDRETQPGIETWPGFVEGDEKQCPLFDYHIAMQWDLQQVGECDAIVMLPGWETSSGAKVERLVAEHAGKLITLAHRTGGGWFFQPDADQKRMEPPCVRKW